jgi:hypothetical protein
MADRPTKISRLTKLRILLEISTNVVFGELDATSERFAPLARITNVEIVQKVFIFWAVSFFWGVWSL